MAEEGKVAPAERLNQTMDLGNLIYEDTQSYEGITLQEFSKRTADNLCSVYRALYERKKGQDAKHGEDGEILEYERDALSVLLPKGTTVLPREKPAPKEKVATKWEKFRLERGMPARQKRGRLVFDPITKDWVPRWGKDSVKKIEEKHNWIMEEKPKHVASGIDPFEYKRIEKKAG